MITRALVAASAKPIILSLLLSGENYGYQILKRVQKVSGNAIDWSEAMLYPVLHRLERDGLIKSEWRLTEKNRMRKYYLLTELGRQDLETEKSQWLCVHKALMRLWRPAAERE
ncbi:MAG: helix-turn-helix transcriptional regulator [Acidobacteriota bacterium]